MAKILAKITNQMEREIYIDKLSKEYKISKEAIIAEINKLVNKQSLGGKKLEKRLPTMEKTNEQPKNEIKPEILKRENMVIYLLINEPARTYEKLKQVISIDDFKSELNK